MNVHIGILQKKIENFLDVPEFLSHKSVTFLFSSIRLKRTHISFQ